MASSPILIGEWLAQLQLSAEHGFGTVYVFDTMLPT